MEAGCSKDCQCGGYQKAPIRICRKKTTSSFISWNPKNGWCIGTIHLHVEFISMNSKNTPSDTQGLCYMSTLCRGTDSASIGRRGGLVYSPPPTMSQSTKTLTLFVFFPLPRINGQSVSSSVENRGRLRLTDQPRRKTFADKSAHLCTIFSMCIQFIRRLTGASTFAF